MKCQAGRSIAGIKIAERSINNLRYADDTILMAESILMKAKEESEKIPKSMIMTSGPIIS